MRYKVVSVAPEWTVKRTSPCCPFYVKSNLQPLDLKVQVVVDKHASSGWILVHAYSQKWTVQTKVGCNKNAVDYSVVNGSLLIFAMPE